MKSEKKINSGSNLARRDFLKAAAGVPVIGGFAIAVGAKKKQDSKARSSVLGELKDKKLTRTGPKWENLNLTGAAKNRKLRLGIVGVGIRGKQLMHSAGFPNPDIPAPGFEWLGQPPEPLNVEFVAACDLFDPNLEWAVKASGGRAKKYRHYEELVADPNVDAVIVATSDHYHAAVTIAAAKAGKHVYCEKCMTHDIAEALEVRDTVKSSGIVFQLGHQNRNSRHYDSAMKVVDNDFLGKINLIECYYNRDRYDGAWVYDIPIEHGPKNAERGPRNLDWEQFTANTVSRPYDPNRFFRWRCFWDYGTGISGDLMTHEMDVVNMIMDLGIPTTAVASGGINFHKEFTTMMTAKGEPISAGDQLPEGARPRPDVPVLNREVPDVYQVIFDFPDRDLNVVFNSTLANSWEREQLYLGTQASMDLTGGVDVYPCYGSVATKYRELIERGEVRIGEPMLSFRDTGGNGVEALTSATSQWTVAKGLLYTYIDGEQVNVTTMHLNNWLDHIRAEDTNTMCDVDDGFVESLTAHMATLSYKKGCRVRWDEKNERVVSDAQPLEPEHAGDSSIASTG